MASRQKLPTPSAGISRIDQESTRTHGFVGRVGYRRTDSGWRPQFTAFFGDRSHGSAAESLRAAEKWLRAIKKQIGGSGTSRGAAKKAGAKRAGSRKTASRGRSAR
jgi:hypothetical protein